MTRPDIRYFKRIGENRVTFGHLIVFSDVTDILGLCTCAKFILINFIITCGKWWVKRNYVSRWGDRQAIGDWSVTFEWNNFERIEWLKYKFLHKHSLYLPTCLPPSTSHHSLFLSPLSMFLPLPSLTLSLSCMCNFYLDYLIHWVKKQLLHELVSITTYSYHIFQLRFSTSSIIPFKPSNGVWQGMF